MLCNAQMVDVPGRGKTFLGDLTSTEMVQLYVKPKTEKIQMDYVQVCVCVWFEITPVLETHPVTIS